MTTDTNAHHLEEIDLMAVVRGIFRQRGLIFSITLIFTLSVLILQFSSFVFLSTQQAVKYPIVIEFTSPTNSSYPNGTSFSAEDIINPAYVKSALEKMQLDNGNIRLKTILAKLSINNTNTLLKATEQELLNHLDVEPKFRDRAKDILNETKTALDDLYNIAKAYWTLELNLSGSGISDIQAKELLETIVIEWANDANVKGLVNPDIAFSRQPYVMNNDVSVIENYDNLNTYTKQLQKAVQQLSSIKGSEAINVNNMSLTDIKQKLRNINDNEIQVMRSYAYAISPILMKKDPATEVLVVSKQRVKKLDKARIEKMIDVYDKILASLNTNTVSYAQEANQEASQLPVTTNTSTQLDSSMLGELLNLGSQVSISELRKSIIDRRLQASEALFQLEQEIAIIDSNSMKEATLTVARQKIIEQLPNTCRLTAKKVNHLHSIFLTMVDEFSRIQLNKRANLYSALGRPAIIDKSGSLVQKTKLRLAAATLMGLMLGLLVALMRQTSWSKIRDQKSTENTFSE